MNTLTAIAVHTANGGKEIFKVPKPETQPDSGDNEHLPDWHPGNILYYAKPEDRKLITSGRIPINPYWDAAVIAALESAYSNAKSYSKVKGVGRNWNEGFKAAFPIVIPPGVYMSERPMMKPPGVSVVGGDNMSAVTIRVKKSRETVTVMGEKLSPGMVMLGGIDYADLKGIKGYTHSVSGIRYTSWNGSAIVGFVMQGWHANMRLRDFAVLGGAKVNKQGYGVASINQARKVYQLVGTSSSGIGEKRKITARKETGVLLDPWWQNLMIERMGVGVLMSGALEGRINGSIWYCSLGLALVNCTNCKADVGVSDRWNSKAVLGITELGVFVSGRNNQVEGWVQYAADAAVMNHGIGNRVLLLKDQSGAGKEDAKSNRGVAPKEGDYNRTGRKIWRWNMMDRVWGPPLAAYKRLQKREEAK